MRCAALNTGSEWQTLDHIAPLAAMIGMPLITTEAKNQELLCRYYPQIEVRYFPDLEINLGALAEEFDALFECKYWRPELKLLFEQLYRKKMRLVFCPHGQSDKGFEAPVLSPYGVQDIVLVYGDLLIQMLKDLGIWSSISDYLVVGNYRLAFYQQHRAFYDALAAKQIPLDRNKRTLLYAPTWRDVDGNTSFFTYGKKLLAELPSDWNLIIKPHPFLEEKDPAQFYPIAALAEKKSNVFLLPPFPPIYPVLNLADVYLGDASSIGYDYLFFGRPLYFFPTRFQGRLHSCGTILDPQREIYSQLALSSPLQEAQKRLYDYAFKNQIKI